jgi:hypothetical protein
MSTGKRTVKYAAAAVVLAAVLIGLSTYYVSLTTPSGPMVTSGSPGPGQSVLVVQLTDPPQVPGGTSSLNLTYSAVNLLVSQPAFNGQVIVGTVSVTPLGGSGSVDLLQLRNISQTVASDDLPTGSTIYTISFTVESVAIDINGTVNGVSLATGRTTVVTTLVHPVSLNRSEVVLLELNPEVVSTPTGYQLIPYTVGVLKPQSEYRVSDQHVGAEDRLSRADQGELKQAVGQAERLLGW